MRQTDSTYSVRTVKKVATEADEEYIRDLCAKFSGSAQNDMGFTEYTENGQENIATYLLYRRNRAGFFIVSDSSAEIFATTDRLKQIMMFCR